MVYRLFIEGRIGKTLFCGYLVKKDLEARGFFIELSRAKDLKSQAFTQGLRQILLENAVGYRRKVILCNPLRRLWQADVE